jgi:hypothetical protein
MCAGSAHEERAASAHEDVVDPIESLLQEHAEALQKELERGRRFLANLQRHATTPL